MNAKACILIVLACLAPAVRASEVDDYIEKKLPPPTGEEAPYEYYIIHYKPEFLPVLLDIVEGRRPGSRRSAIAVLATVAGEHVPEIEFSIFRKLGEEREAAAMLAANFDTLAGGGVPYGIWATMETNEGLELLKQRVSHAYWLNHPMPRFTYYGPDQDPAKDTPNLITAQGQAIGCFGLHPSPEAAAFLNACLKDPRYANDPYLKRSLETALALRSEVFKWKQQREAAWTKRQRLEAADIIGPASLAPKLSPTMSASAPSARATPANVHATASTLHPPSSGASKLVYYLIVAVFALGPVALLVWLVRRKA